MRHNCCNRELDIPINDLFSTARASLMYSRLCMKMSSLKFVRAWPMPSRLYLSCEIPIFALGAWYHFRFNISCGVAVTVRSYQQKFQVIFLRGGEKAKKIWRENF